MNKKITVYTSKTCTYCDQVKDKLKESSIKFTEIDIIELGIQMGGEDHGHDFSTEGYIPVKKSIKSLEEYLREAEGNIPNDPVNIAATSLSISPNKLSVKITSNCFG